MLKTNKIYVVTVACLLVLLASTVAATNYMNNSDVWLTVPKSEPSYIIGLYNSTHYYAQNATGYGTTANMGYEYLSTNASYVFNTVINKSPYGKIFVKSGTYTFTKPIIILKGTTLEGENWNSTILRRDASFTGSIIKIGDDTNWIYYTSIKNFYIHGNAVGQNGVGIAISKAQDVTLEQVLVRFFRDDVMIDNGTQYLYARELICQNFNHVGLYLKQTTEHPGHYVFDRLESSIASTMDNTVAIYCAARTSDTIARLTFVAPTLMCPSGLSNTTGIWFDGSSSSSSAENWLFNGGNIETFTTMVLWGDNPSKDIIFEGVGFYGNSVTTTAIKGTNYKGECTLIGCIFYSLTTAIDATLLSRVTVIHPQFSSVSTSFSGTKYIVYGYAYQNSGSHPIGAASNTSCVVSHGLAGTPTFVSCSFSGTGWGSWSWSATSSQITITIETSVSVTVYWSATYKP